MFYHNKIVILLCCSLIISPVTLNAFAVDPKILVKDVVIDQSINPFEIKLTNDTYIFKIDSDGVIKTGKLNSFNQLPSTTSNSVIITDSDGYLTTSAISTTILNFLSTLSSDVQTQINTKQSTVSGVSDVEIGHLDGVTSGIQNQLDIKETISSHNTDNSTITTALATKYSASNRQSSIVDSELSSGIDAIKIGDGSVTSTEFQRINTVSSNVQDQIDSKQALLGFTAEDSANKGSASGYAGLDSSSKITNNLSSAKQIPILSSGMAVITNSSGYIDTSSLVSSTELSYLDNASSELQAQITARETISSHNTDNSTITTALATKYSASNRQSSIITSEISDDQITYGKIQNIVNDDRVLGRISGADGVIEELTTTQFTSLVNAFTQTLSGVVPAPVTINGYYLRDDGSWQPISGSGISEVNTIEGGNARLSKLNSTTEIILKNFADSSTISWTNGTGSLTSAVVTGSIDDVELGTNIDAIQIGGGGVTSSEFDFLADVTSLIQAQINGKQTTTLTDGNILVGSSGNVASSVNPSGAVDVSNTGVFSIPTLAGIADVSDGCTNGQTHEYQSSNSTWICANDDSGGGTAREELVSIWGVDVTKTNIGTSFVQVYTATNGNGDGVRIDTNGMSTVTLEIMWTKIGAGIQTCEIRDISNAGNVLVRFGSLVNGQNTNATQDIPSSMENTIKTYQPVCKSTTSTDDPIWLNGVVLLRP